MSYGRSTESSDDSMSGLAVAGIIVGCLVGVWLLFVVIDWATSRATPQAGEIGVVRTGQSFWWAPAWFNGHGIRQVVPPGSGSTYIGIGSETHWYPSDTVQRNYTITSDRSRGDRPGVDVVEVPTSDGVRVGLEGTFYFTTNFNGGPQGQTSVKDFDNRFGVRTFPVVGSGDELHPWDGIDGWEAFLDTVVRPIIDNDLRRSIANVTCSQLVSSCALVQQNGGAQKVVANGGAQNNSEIAQIQDEINSSLQSDIKSTLGQDYFSDIRFLLAKVTLPGAIQSQIDSAQAQYAAVATSKAKVQQETLNAQANEQREKGFRACPACAQAAILQAIPPTVKVFAPGGNFAVTPESANPAPAASGKK